MMGSAESMEFMADDRPIFELTTMSVYSNEVEEILEWRL